LDVVGLDAVVLLEEVKRKNCDAGGIVDGSMDDSCWDGADELFDEI